MEFNIDFTVDKQHFEESLKGEYPDAFPPLGYH
jgi:hypothetical protein